MPFLKRIIRPFLSPKSTGGSAKKKAAAKKKPAKRKTRVKKPAPIELQKGIMCPFGIVVFFHGIRGDTHIVFTKEKRIGKFENGAFSAITLEERANLTPLLKQYLDEGYKFHE